MTSGPIGLCETHGLEAKEPNVESPSYPLKAFQRSATPADSPHHLLGHAPNTSKDMEIQPNTGAHPKNSCTCATLPSPKDLTHSSHLYFRPRAREESALSAPKASHQAPKSHRTASPRAPKSSPHSPPRCRGCWPPHSAAGGCRRCAPRALATCPAPEMAPFEASKGLVGPRFQVRAMRLPIAQEQRGDRGQRLFGQPGWLRNKRAHARR